MLGLMILANFFPTRLWAGSCQELHAQSSSNHIQYIWVYSWLEFSLSLGNSKSKVVAHIENPLLEFSYTNFPSVEWLPSWVYGMGTCIIHGYQQQGFPKTLDRAGAMVGLEEVYIYFLIITKIIDLYQSSGRSPVSWSPNRSRSLSAKKSDQIVIDYFSNHFQIFYNPALNLDNFFTS